MRNNTKQLYETLLQPEVLDICVQYELERAKHKLNTNARHLLRTGSVGHRKLGYKPNYKFKPPTGQRPIPAHIIIEEQSALTGFSKASTIKAYGNED